MHSKLKIYEHLVELKSQIKEMKSDLSSIKNKNIQIRLAKRINSTIDSVSIIKGMLSSKLRTDVLDTLIYTLMHEIMQQHKVFDGSEIPLGEMQRTFEDAFEYHSDYSRIKLVRMLESHELSNLTKKYEGNELAEKILEVRTEKEWIEKLEEFAKTYKRLIKWDYKPLK